MAPVVYATRVVGANQPAAGVIREAGHLVEAIVLLNQLVCGVIGERSGMVIGINDCNAIAGPIIRILGDDVAGVVRACAGKGVLSYTNQPVKVAVRKRSDLATRINHLLAPATGIYDHTEDQVLVNWLASPTTPSS
jgi:hypothetical protein